MISYFSDRARENFVPPETALRGRRTANKAKTTLTKRPMGAPEGRSDTTYRLINSAQLFVRAPGESYRKSAHKKIRLFCYRPKTGREKADAMLPQSRNYNCVSGSRFRLSMSLKYL